MDGSSSRFQRNCAHEYEQVTILSVDGQKSGVVQWQEADQRFSQLVTVRSGIVGDKKDLLLTLQQRLNAPSSIRDRIVT